MVSFCGTLENKKWVLWMAEKEFEFVGEKGMMATEKLSVRMLGDFSIRRGDREVVKKGNRSKKIWQLIGILLTNRGKKLPQEELIRLLWREGDECIDPANSLKNLVYRARMLLDDLAQEGETFDEEMEMIRFSNGAYLWNEEFPCEIDTEIMQLLAKRGADEEQTVESRIACYTRALQLYSGDFLLNLGEDEWIFAKRAQYQSLYVGCVLKLCRLLNQSEQYDHVIAVCEHALQFCPFQEDIHHALLKAYLRTGQYAQALAHYEHLSDSFNRELGMGLSSSVRHLHHEIIQGLNMVENDLNRIRNDIFAEEGLDSSPFFCEYSVFRELCRVQMRSQERCNQSAVLLLLTVSDKNGDVPPLEKLQNVMTLLKESIFETLRRNDIVARYSPSQFILGLLMAEEENGQLVADRIRAAFEAKCRRKGEIRLKDQMVSLRE